MCVEMVALAVSQPSSLTAQPEPDDDNSDFDEAEFGDHLDVRPLLLLACCW
jgi:hypothetical protein